MTQTPGAGSLTTLPLAPGNYPFALSAEELLLDGDWWAWQFLRRNPFYRRDHELQAASPELLARRSNQPIWRGMGPPPRLVPGEYGELDCRHFCAHGEVLSGDVDWPICKPLSLTAYQQRHPSLCTADITVRDFDSAVTYGITWWFDPSEADLPPLPAGQSWFYNLVEPLWEVGNPDIRLVEVLHADPRFGKTVVGFSPDEPLRIVALEHFRYEVRHTTEGKSETVNLPIERPWGTGFSSQTDLAFLVSLDEEIASQLRPLKVLAAGLKAISPTVVTAARPFRDAGVDHVILRPDHALARPLSRLQGHIEMLSRQARRRRANWRVVHLDVSSSIDKQFKALEADLLRAQTTADKLQKRSLKRKDRKRNASPRDFWLKKFLCLLELQEALTAHNNGKPPGAERIGEAINDAEHRLHRLIRPDAVARSTSPARKEVLSTEPYKAALAQAKDFSLGLYEYLVGQTPWELRTE